MLMQMLEELFLSHVCVIATNMRTLGWFPISRKVLHGVNHVAISRMQKTASLEY